MRANICKGCGRRKATCWAMPCLVLEIALEKGVGAVNRWLRGTGMRVVRKT